MSASAAEYFSPLFTSKQTIPVPLLSHPENHLILVLEFWIMSPQKNIANLDYFVSVIFNKSIAANH